MSLWCHSDCCCINFELPFVQHFLVAVCCRGPVSDVGGKGDVSDGYLAPVLAMQIESELSVSYDSESPVPVEHNEHGSHTYSQTAHHPLLLQV